MRTFALLFLLFLQPLPLFALTVDGTGDSQVLLQRLAIEFNRKHPEITLEVPPSVGSSGGIRLLLQGRTDLARVARQLRPEEVSKGLLWQEFAVVPIVFAANLPEKCVADLSSNQVLDIFSGKINRWSQLGDCPEQKIYLARRENGDSSNSVLDAKIDGLREIENPAGKTIFTTPEAFNTISNYPYTLGYLPLSQMVDSSLIRLSFNGISVTPDTVRNGRYELVLPLAIAWKPPLKKEARLFLEYLGRSEAQELIRSFGAIPKSPRGF